MKRVLKGLGINIILLGMVSFLTDLSSEMMFAILPFFITALGGSGVAVGLIGGVGESAASMVKLFSGYWSDKVRKRKPFAVLGYLLSSVAKLFFPFVSNWGHLLILRFMERTGKGVRTPPRDALIASSCSGEERGKAFGFHRAADTGGAIAGSLLAFLLFWFLRLDFKWILLAGALLSFLSLIPLVHVKENPPSGRLSQERLSLRMSIKGLPPPFRRYLIVAVIFSLANFTYMFFVLKAKALFQPFFHGRLATAVPLLLYCWFNLVYATFSLPGGILSDKIGRRMTLMIGYSLFSLCCMGFVLVKGLLGYILLFAVYGLSYALIEGNQRAYASDFVTEELRGTALGTFHSAVGFTALLAGLLAGFLWNLNPEWPFICGAVLSLTAAIGMI